MIIGGTLVTGTGEPVYGVDPRTGDRLEPGYRGAGADDLDRACQLAEQAFEGYRSAPIAARADFLDAIATGIEALGATLVARAGLESGLPEARLTGELARTTGQLRPVRPGAARGQLAGRPDRPGQLGPPGHPAAPDPGGPGRGVRCEQLPAGVLGGRRRHRSPLPPAARSW